MDRVRVVVQRVGSQSVGYRNAPSSMCHSHLDAVCHVNDLPEPEGAQYNPPDSVCRASRTRRSLPQWVSCAMGLNGSFWFNGLRASQWVRNAMPCERSSTRARPIQSTRFKMQGFTYSTTERIAFCAIGSDAPESNGSVLDPPVRAAMMAKYYSGLWIRGSDVCPFSCRTVSHHELIAGSIDGGTSGSEL